MRTVEQKKAPLSIVGGHDRDTLSVGGKITE
jgi:hypothetical protein